MTSPLSQVNPESLDYLFNQDPLTMTDETVGKIVDALRADRARFLAQPDKPAKTKKQAADLNVSLEDLGL